MIKTRLQTLYSEIGPSKIDDVVKAFTRKYMLILF